MAIDRERPRPRALPPLSEILTKPVVFPAGLPPVLTPIIGREREQLLLENLLRDAAVRLVTVIGPGGVGKTRLSIEVARMLSGSFVNGGVFVSLAALRDPALLASTVLAALGLPEPGHGDPETVLLKQLASLNLLLILDNCEHLPGVGPFASRLLAACPRLTILATSRSRLQVLGEQIVTVTPLALPQLQDATETARATDAVRLFEARARELDPEFRITPANVQAVAAICQRLDGLPLAIELATARLSTLPPAALLARLEPRLPLLTSTVHGRPAHHQTMRDAIAWSYDLLNDAQQAMFRNLTVFAGGFTLDAAREVSGLSDLAMLDGLNALIASSLIRTIPGSDEESRFTTLETIREFGLDQLTASEEAMAVREAHAAWCQTLAAEASAHLTGANQAIWLQRLEREHDNVRAALTWSIETSRSGITLDLVTSLWMFWYVRGHVDEGRRWLERALEAGGETLEAARVLLAAGHLAHYHGDDDHAVGYVQRSLTLGRELGDDGLVGRALLLSGIIAEDQGDYATAMPLMARAETLFESHADLPFLAMTRYHESVVAYGRGDLGGAERIATFALEPARLANDTFSISAILIHLGMIAGDRGDLDPAKLLLREGLDLYRVGNDREGIARTLANVALIAAAYQAWPTAARLFGHVARIQTEIGYGFQHHPERPRYERANQAIRQALGADGYEAELAAGKLIEVDGLIAEFEEATNQSVLNASGGAESAANAAGLTRRELAVLELIAEGQTDRQISEVLFIGRRTVETHVRNILGKLAVDSRTAAAARALREGLV